jgi:putative peptidoglycan lipid II flippase
MLPATFGLAATQLNILVDTVLASNLGDGPITWLSLAFRLMQLPIGLFGVAIATANLTRVSRDAAAGDTEGLRRNLASALRAAALLTLPATAGLVALRVPIVRMLFEHGRFSPEATGKTAGAVLCYGLGLYAYSVTKIQVPTFYALGDSRVPVAASATAVGLKIAANLALLAILPAVGVDPFLALALTTSLAAWTNFAILGWGLRARIGPMGDMAVVGATWRMVLVAATVGAASWGVQQALESALPGGGLAGEIGRLAASVTTGAAVTLAGATVLRVPEGAEILRRLARRTRA